MAGNRITAYIVLITRPDGMQRVHMQEDGLIYMTRCKEYAEEEAAKLKVQGLKSEMKEVTGPPGMGFNGMQLYMTKSYMDIAQKSKQDP